MKTLFVVVLLTIGITANAQSRKYPITWDNIMSDTICRDTLTVSHNIFLPPADKVYYREPNDISFIFVRRRIHK